MLLIAACEIIATASNQQLTDRLSSCTVIAPNGIGPDTGEVSSKHDTDRYWLVSLIPNVTGSRWSFVVCMWTCYRESLGQLWTVLQRGLETIRSIGSNSLDVDMLVHLARTFSDRVCLGSFYYISSVCLERVNFSVTDVTFGHSSRLISCC